MTSPGHIPPDTFTENVRGNVRVNFTLTFPRTFSLPESRR